MSRFILLCITGILSFSVVHAELKLASLFSDNMVIQRDSYVPVWGFADPMTEVAVRGSWCKQWSRVTSDSAGKWKVYIKTPPAGGPFSIWCKSKSDKAEVRNVLSGEVWLCGGQSNMEMTVRGSLNQPVLHANDILMDVVKAGYSIKANWLSQNISHLPKKEQEKILKIVEILADEER